MGVEDLPTLNASLNAATTVVVLSGWWAVKQKKLRLHKVLMLSGVFLSACFLTSYLVYHLGVGSEKKFQGQGWVRPLYFAMLISHILLAFAVVPLVLLSVWHGLKDNVRRHVRLVRITLPIWLYVSVTGVLIYLALYGGSPPA